MSEQNGKRHNEIRIPVTPVSPVLTLPIAPAPARDPDLRMVLCDAGRPVLNWYDGGHVSIPAVVTLHEAARVWARCFKTPQKRSKR